MTEWLAEERTTLDRLIRTKRHYERANVGPAGMVSVADVMVGNRLRGFRLAMQVRRDNYRARAAAYVTEFNDAPVAVEG